MYCQTKWTTSTTRLHLDPDKIQGSVYAVGILKLAAKVISWVTQWLQKPAIRVPRSNENCHRKERNLFSLF